MTLRAHPYMANSAAPSTAALLAALGVDDVEELFDQIPKDHRSPVELVPGIASELELRRRLESELARNESTQSAVSFLGSGYWDHYVPALCDEIAARPEIATSVWGTPSSDHGRNQIWFEFASQLGELVGLEFVGLPVYSWGCAAGHAVRMAARLTGRSVVLVPASMNPERRRVLQTYCGPPEMAASIRIVDIAVSSDTGQLDLDDLVARLDDTVAAVYVDTPNHWGMIETEIARICELAHDRGAEAIVGVDPISLGLLRSPAELGADIVVGSIQPLGVPLYAGGGAGGFIASRDEERYAREYPTLQVSIAPTVVPGQHAFGPTLFHQSSYGSREDGNDWTGNSVYLWAVRAAVYMTLLGPAGFVDLGRTLVLNARDVAERLDRLPGISVRWTRGFFKELVVDFHGTGLSVAEINQRLRRRNIFGGEDLSTDFPQLGQSALYCVTEKHTIADIDALVSALEEVTGK